MNNYYSFLILPAMIALLSLSDAKNDRLNKASFDGYMLARQKPTQNATDELDSEDLEDSANISIDRSRSRKLSVRSVCETAGGLDVFVEFILTNSTIQSPS